MKLRDFKLLIREEVRKVLKEDDQRMWGVYEWPNVTRENPHLLRYTVTKIVSDDTAKSFGVKLVYTSSSREKAEKVADELEEKFRKGAPYYKDGLLVK
jgi:hypothetical protein